MSIITALNLNKSCRYYICNKYKTHLECVKVSEKEYNPEDNNSFKYCREFEIFDKFRLFVDNLDFKIPVIKRVS